MKNTRFIPNLIVVVLLSSFEVSFSRKTTTNINTDQLALLALKSHVISDPQNLLATNWSTVTHVCNWIGVTCGSRYKRVTALNLFGMNLSGTIPPHLGNLSFLSTLRLSLSGNNFMGVIPSSLCSLSKLELLGLSRNNLQGQIPVAIGNLSSLRWLYLSKNQFSGFIPSSVFNISSLVEIVLGYNQLIGQIPLQFGNLLKLEVLHLGVNSIYGTIPPFVFNSSALNAIALTANRLSGYLPSTIGFWLPRLEILELGDNELSGSIPASISNASRLSFLSFGSNSFSGYIPIDLGNLRELQFLGLGQNNLASTPSSSELSFLSSLANCKHLRLLEFSINPMISGKLPVSIGNLSVEQVLANGCNIKGSIPGEIGNVSNLISLDLDNNKLSGSLPTTIGRLKNLQRLSLQGNKLGGFFPTELCNLKSLSYLYFTGNNLVGPIPACLGDLISLRYLFLGSNKFANSIPSTFTRLTDILQLNLSSNCLSGALPVDIGKWKVITSIDFSKNQLSGEISISIGDLRDLTYLSLSGNRLQGPIPESFGGLISLQVLDLSRNNFSGIIPKSFEKLLYLEHFNVSFNRLEGEIPSKGSFGNYTIQSFMGNKALCAAPQLQLPLPPCKANSFGKHSRKAIQLVEYILFPIGSIILVLAVILTFSRRGKRNANLPTAQENFPALAEWRRVSYQELQQATYGFSESKLLGVGSFGSVYQGILSDGLSVAVKVFNLELEGAFKSFDVECEVLRNIRHRNLVRIISSCSNIDFKALVLEFMPSGSLEKWLYSHNHFLDILHRLNIMIDVASALEYLHHGYTTPVIHCDLKPNNILLDEDMVAHLGDFGIAKLLGEHDSTIHTMTLATIGYMAPEYGSEGIVSTKGDVYSFGILLMETFTRKKPTDEIFAGEMSIKYWVKSSLPEALIEVVDTNLLNNEARQYSARRDCALSILQLALECTEEVPEDRIDVKEVVAKLNKIKIKFLHESNRRA
ncbi:probable LRR receptor-like serine/threonine-protein kinase At3g47570 [Durio zibethinus]|uniref:non-specific serine/threonine protein kinase n=1 Tax=Durio zibethinus TaxID=66656 RepID=A0A6P5Y505_DURZI|nr:probable LRR receptor-like serine/threonine-protein kinase At3g47570 [Durio zibethinus]